MSYQFDIEQFSRRAEIVGQLVRAEDVFSLMRRRVALPTGCAAQVWGASGQPRLVGEGGSVSSDDAKDVLFVRTVGFELHYELSGLRSEDGYDFAGSLDMSVRIVAERSELEQFRQALFGSKRFVDVERLHRHCEECARSALTEFTAARTASDLITATTWDAFDALLVARFKPVGFACGLAMGPDPRVTFSSPAYAEIHRAEKSASLRKQRLETEAGVRSAAVEASRTHLSRVEAVLAEARALASEHDDVGVADLIRTFDPAQRGDLYHALYAAGDPTKQTDFVVVAAGNELIWLRPFDSATPHRRQALDASIGGLRSARVRNDNGERALLVGAGTGVHVVNADDGPTETYVYKNGERPRGGVNAAAITGGALYATHSELGLVRWTIGVPDAHESCLADLTDHAQSVRDVQTDETGRLWFSVNERVIGWKPDSDEPPETVSAPDQITVLLVADGYVIAGLADGGIVRWPLFDLDAMERIRGATHDKVRSLAWVGGGGVARLLVGDGQPHLDLQVLGDAHRSEYRAAQPVRWGYAADDMIVGVTDNRDHLLVWRRDMPTEPAVTIAIGRLCGHSIQDVALLPTPAGRA